MCSFSKSSIITDCSRFTLTTILLSNLAEEFTVKTGLSLRWESAFDVDIFLSIITGCDCLLDFLGKVLLRKWACLSRLSSPVCNGKLFPWRAALRAQAIVAERGLLWLSVVLEDKNANSLWRSPLIMTQCIVRLRQKVLIYLKKKSVFLAALFSTWPINYITLRLLVISSARASYRVQLSIGRAGRSENLSILKMVSIRLNWDFFRGKEGRNSKKSFMWRYFSYFKDTRYS